MIQANSLRDSSRASASTDRGSSSISTSPNGPRNSHWLRSQLIPETGTVSSACRHGITAAAAPTGERTAWLAITVGINQCAARLAPLGGRWTVAAWTAPLIDSPPVSHQAPLVFRARRKGLIVEGAARRCPLAVGPAKSFGEGGMPRANAARQQRSHVQ